MTATPAVESVPLHQAASERYLSYALSVITSRALPDVRDGLKPVQRRILYTMFHDMGLHPGGRYRKCAAVVGEVMGKYHPHGDASIYEALVRMAQDFALRVPLVDGHGNFGSLDGDPAAAMRYTECKLRQLAEDLLTEIKKRTVDFRPNYDGQRFEPIVLPAQFPHLLVNGSEGIAVGMATRIPPHNLGEVVDAAVALIDDPELSVAGLMRYVRGPDFPTGGRILAETADLLEIYETGQGTLRVQAEYEVEKTDRRRAIVVTSIPYGQNKARILERIGEEVRNRKLPQVVDVRDESTEEVRIVLELKQGAEPEPVMAWLYKRTPLQTTWPVNLTALVPSDRPDVATPARLDLKQILRHWLDFRLETVRRRFVFDLEQLRERIHILEGFAKVFDALDEAIRIIRDSEGRRDAAERLIERFELSDAQADAILELRLYKLARLEIQLILEELAEKREEAAAIERMLRSDRELWARVRQELLALRSAYPDPRRTLLGQPEQALEFDEDVFIVEEDAWVVVTRDGWIKRQSSFTGIDKIRIRDADEIGWLFRASTRSTVTFFSNLGSAYVVRVDAVPATTGYGDPLQRHFAFADGERVVGVISNDPRHLEAWRGADEGDAPPPHGVAMTLKGRALRFPLSAHVEPSTRNGRRYARLDAGDAIFAVYGANGTERVGVATRGGRAAVFLLEEVPVLKAPGKGVLGVRLRDGDEIVAFELGRNDQEGPTVVTSFGRELVVNEKKFGIGRRGGRGKVVLQRGSIDQWKRGPAVSSSGAPSGTNAVEGEE